MSTTQLTSTVVSALDSQNVIVSLKSPAERRRLSIKLIASWVMSGQRVACVTNDVAMEAEIKYMMREAHVPDLWIGEFIRMSPQEFHSGSQHRRYATRNAPALVTVEAIVVPDFDLLTLMERNMIEDGLVALRLDDAINRSQDELPDGDEYSIVVSIAITVSQQWDVNQLARLVNARIIEPDLAQNASRTRLALTLDDHRHFETHLLEMQNYYWWHMHEYERVMVTMFGGVLAFANMEDIELHRTQLVARGFLEQTPEEGGYYVTKLGKFALDNSLDRLVAYELARQSVAAMSTPGDVYPLD